MQHDPRAALVRADRPDIGRRGFRHCREAQDSWRRRGDAPRRALGRHHDRHTPPPFPVPMLGDGECECGFAQEVAPCALPDGPGIVGRGDRDTKQDGRNSGTRDQTPTAAVPMLDQTLRRLSHLWRRVANRPRILWRVGGDCGQPREPHFRTRHDRPGESARFRGGSRPHRRQGTASHQADGHHHS
jgi:hypothetical protein